VIAEADQLLTTSEEKELKRAVSFAYLLRKRSSVVPADEYEPHHHVFREGGARPLGETSGQLQFHQATQPVRVAAPGNGWGGTLAMACEIDAWMRHLNRWQETPDWPVIAVWFCPEFRQLAILLQTLRQSSFGSLPRFTEGGFGGPRFIWSDGGTLYLASYDRSWTHLQGIELDLIAFDEQPPEALWREMAQRRRAQRKTKYVCKATQTLGRTWMATDIYEPWRTHHEAPGLDEHQACD
jgi:phage terminase large subunit-like protein